MTDERYRRSLLVRIRAKLAAPEPVNGASVAAGPALDQAPERDAVLEPPRRQHLYGSTYRVRMSFDELMTERGRTGTAGLYRRSLVPPSDTQRQRDAATLLAGYMPGEVLWPSDTP